jgi:hypothetical protein
MKLKWILLFLLLFGALGYYREFFFVHINRIMYGKYYSMNAYEHDAMPLIMKPFDQWTYAALYYAKYPFTLVFTLAFFLLSKWCLRKLSSAAVLLNTLNYAYLLMLGLAALSMAYGLLVKDRLQNDEYTLSRWLLGIAQSPIICLILLASEKLYFKSFQSDKNL